MSFDLSKAIEILTGKIEGWLETLTSMLPNMVVAVLVLVLFYFIARIVKTIAGRVLNRFFDQEAINNLFSTIFYIATLSIGLMVALNILHLKQTVTSLLAGAGIIGLALGFAFQDISANFISGIMIAIRKPFGVGDIIEAEDYMGVVEKINLRVTIIRTFQGLHVIIPNKEVFQSPMINFTKTNERRIDLEVGVSYGDDLEKVQDVAVKAVAALPMLLEDKDVELHYHSFGDSSINFTVMFWIEYPGQPGFLKARSEAVKAIKKAFDENDITIPFPILTLDFGIKGGEKLSNMEMNVMSKNGSNN